jgi:hypothetical protein
VKIKWTEWWLHIQSTSCIVVSVMMNALSGHIPGLVSELRDDDCQNVDDAGRSTEVEAMGDGSRRIVRVHSLLSGLAMMVPVG